MSPEYGATCGFFPVDEMTLDYLRLTGRSPERIALVEAYCKENLLWHDPTRARDVLAGRRARPRRRRAVARRARAARRTACRSRARSSRSSRRSARSASTTRTARTTRRSPTRSRASDPTTEQQPGGRGVPSRSRSRPSLIAAAEPPPRSRRRRRLRARPRLRRDRRDHVVHEHLEPAGDGRRRACSRGTPSSAASSASRGSSRRSRPARRSSRATTSRPACTPTSTSSASTPSATAARRASATPGPLPDEISAAIAEGDLVVCSVLSGNRNFEARIHPEVKANYLASPPLVVAYALAGRMDIDFETEPLGTGSDGDDVYLRDIWPSAARSATRSRRPCAPSSSPRPTPTSSPATTRGARCRCPRASSSPGSPTRRTCGSRRTSRGCRASPGTVADIDGARVLVWLGDSVTTDHISPAGVDQARLARRASTWSSTASSARTSTRTARGAATTR